MNELGLAEAYEFWFEIPFDVIGSSNAAGVVRRLGGSDIMFDGSI
jgi:hypothetical protein